jgi:hypothetical protein
LLFNRGLRSGRRIFAASGTWVQALIASSCLARHAATAFQNSSAVGQSLRSAAASALGGRRSLQGPRSFKISNAALKRSNRFHHPRSKFEAALFNLPTKPSIASAACRATAYASRYRHNHEGRSQRKSAGVHPKGDAGKISVSERVGFDSALKVGPIGEWKNQRPT